MTRRRTILIVAGISSLVVAVLVWVLMPVNVPDPVYQGKHLSYWLAAPGITAQVDPHDGLVNPDVRSSSYDGANFNPQVIPPLDTNALPLLLRQLDRHARPIDKPYLRIWKASPAWLKRWLPLPVDAGFSHAVTAILIAKLGPAGRPAVPALVKNLAKDEPAYRVYTVYSLGQIGENSQTIRDAINDYLANTNASLGNSNNIATALTALDKLNHRPTVP